MEKVEFEIPKGKVAEIIRDNDTITIIFKEEVNLDNLKDIDSVIQYIRELAPTTKWADNLWKSYTGLRGNTYVKDLYLYFMVVTALTNNEKRSLTTGEKYYPSIQFCIPGKEENCWSNEITRQPRVYIGTIESEGQRYNVVGGSVISGGTTGLGAFSSEIGISRAMFPTGSYTVSSKRVAEHISKYFGKLLFNVYYGGTNCNWKWVD